jgi:hypothetical protein
MARILITLGAGYIQSHCAKGCCSIFVQIVFRRFYKRLPRLSFIVRQGFLTQWCQSDILFPMGIFAQTALNQRKEQSSLLGGSHARTGWIAP